MNKISSQPLPWKRPLTATGLIGQFAIGQRQIVKSNGKVLLGEYQPRMPQAIRSNRAPRLESMAFPLPINIAQIGENVEQIEHIHECVAIKQRGRQVITAIGTAEHELKLFSWRINAMGMVVQTGMSSAQTGWVAQIAIAHARKFVTAFRTATHQLQLVSWDVSKTGAIYRAGASHVPAHVSVDTGGDAVDKVKLVALSNTLLMTICTTSTGQVKLSSWRLNDDDSLTCLHAYTVAGALVRELVPVVLPTSAAGTRLVIALRTRHGQLKLQRWQVAAAGEITPDAVATIADEKISRFDAVTDEEGRLITAVRTLGGRLKLIAWHCAADGQTIQRLFDSGTGGERIRKHALMLHANQIVTAVQTAAGQGKLIAWTMPADGSMVRIGESLVQNVASVSISLCQETLDGPAPLLTSGLTADGSLKLMTWRA